MKPFEYPVPIQGGEEKVTRQVGLDPKRQELPFDPMPQKEIIQGDPEVTAVRNPGLGSARFGLDGTYYADSVKDDVNLYADQPFFAAGDANPPPAPLVADVVPDTFDVAPSNPAVVQPTGDVVASDKPAPGEQVEGPPQVITKDQIDAAKAAKKGKG
jgi:hypothetical protein